MSEVTPLRPHVAAGDGYSHRDVILDGDGVWWQRAKEPGIWHGFGGADAFAREIPQPWTLVARANEVVDLKRARDAQIAVVEENGELRGAIDRAIASDTSTADEDGIVRALGLWPHLMRSQEVILRAVLVRTDPLRGDA